MAEMSHCSFQTQFASIMELLAQAALAEIHRRVDDRCALVRVELSRSRKDIDALKSKCVMMESELRRVKGRGRRRVWISGCPTSLKSRCVRDADDITSQQHIHNIHQVLMDGISSSEIKEERGGDEREPENVQHIQPQENMGSHTAVLHTEHSGHVRLDVECLRLQVKVQKDIKEEEENLETVGFESNTRDSRHDLWPSEPTHSQNTPVPSQLEHTEADRNHQRPAERTQMESPGRSRSRASGAVRSRRIWDMNRTRFRCSSVDAVKQFSCTFCAKSFKRLNQLKEHLRSHTGEKPFTCHQCGRSFTKHSNLTRHAVVHSREKPFQCVQGGKCFTQRCSLKSHQRIHAGNIT